MCVNFKATVPDIFTLDQCMYKKIASCTSYVYRGFVYYASNS